MAPWAWRRRSATSCASRPKMKMLSAPTRSRISILAPSSVPIVSAPLRRELHVAGAGRLHARGRDLLRQVGGGNDHLGQAHIVVGQEHDPQTVARDRIIVDHPGDLVDQLDDQLGLGVARGRLAGEDFDARDPVPRRVIAHRAIDGDRLQDVEQLALVFMDALDLHVEQRIGIEPQAEAIARPSARTRPCSSAWPRRRARAGRRPPLLRRGG